MKEEIILRKFAERFSSLVKNNSFDISELAQMLGMKSNSTIYRYMNAEMAPKLPTVKYLAEIYNVNPLWLMGYDVPQKIENNKINNEECKYLKIDTEGLSKKDIEHINTYADYLRSLNNSK